jgi:thiol:disulfide interchange protein DsbA
MKHLIWIAALLLVLSACGSKEEPAAVVEEPVVREEAVEPGETTGETISEEVLEETLEVVEESAAVEEEDADEPIVLALAETQAPAREWKYREGPHYTRMIPAQPTVGGADKVEIAEVFMYSCPHCFDLEPNINRWAEELDPGVRFVRIPAMFNRLAALHAQIYYTHEVLARNGLLNDPQAFHMAVFAEFHQRGNRLTNQSVIQKLFERFGVSPDDFNKTWNSFEVNQKLHLAQDLTRRYNISAVPAVVVNGKFHVPNSRETLNILDELLAREGIN